MAQQLTPQTNDVQVTDQIESQGTMKLVLIRHGESEWNKLNLFTGWTDVDLTETCLLYTSPRPRDCS